MNSVPADPYEVLGVDPSVSAAEVRNAYFEAVRAHPPERDPEAFKQVRAAYEVLRSPERRRDADMLRLRDWPEPELKIAPVEVRLTRELIVQAARASSDLARRDFREHYREVKL